MMTDIRDVTDIRHPDRGFRRLVANYPLNWLRITTFLQNTLYWLDLAAGKIAMLELRTGTHRLSPDSVHITDKSHSIRIIQVC